jgi:hypothetical protein
VGNYGFAGQAGAAVPLGVQMAVKIKIIRSKPTRVAVTVRKPDWREFLSY